MGGLAVKLDGLTDTVDVLARIVQKGFSDLEQKLESKADKKDFNNLEETVDRLVTMVVALDAKLENKVDKSEFYDFKNQTLTIEEAILKNTQALLLEKKVSDAQNKRQKKVLEIHNKALKENKILSEKQAAEIEKLRVF